jgi:hypothetical protein
MRNVESSASARSTRVTLCTRVTSTTVAEGFAAVMVGSKSGLGPVSYDSFYGLSSTRLEASIPGSFPFALQVDKRHQKVIHGRL